MVDVSSSSPKSKRTWNWHPEFPMRDAPVMVWPPRPVEALKWLAGRGFLLSQNTLHIGLALITFYFLTPSLERMTVFGIDWIAEIWLRNLLVFTVMTGGLHLYFHVYRKQGDVHRYDGRPLATNDKRFLFGNQVRDNIVWSLASGVTIWTAYEVVIWYAWANSLVPWFAWSDGPFMFIALFVVVWFFNSAHFYFNHRLLHYRFLYRFHRLHHHNVSLGPWSGISMHPVEHVIYLSAMLFHLIVATHPIHMLFHGYLLTVGASLGHTGYEDLQVRGRRIYDVANMFHQLHHRYYNCNYGTMIVPLDRWFGSFHDGTPEATAWIIRNKRMSSEP